MTRIPKGWRCGKYETLTSAPLQARALMSELAGVRGPDAADHGTGDSLGLPRQSVAASRHLGDSFQAASSLDGIYQEVGFSGWYSQTWKKWSRSLPLSRSARAMNWAVVTFP